MLGLLLALAFAALVSLQPWKSDSPTPGSPAPSGPGPSIGEALPGGSPAGPAGVSAARVASAGTAIPVAEPSSARRAAGPSLGVSQARALTASTSAPIAPPPATPEPTPVATPDPAPAPATQPAPPTFVTAPADTGKVVTAAVSPCEDRGVAVTVSLDVEALLAGEPEFDLVIHSPTDEDPLADEKAESELHFDGDWADVQGLVAGLPSEGSCVLVLAGSPAEDEGASIEEGSDVDALDAAETGAEPGLPSP